MIHYSNEGYGPFALNLFCQFEGSVVHLAFLTALFPAILAAFVNHMNYSDGKTFEDFRMEVGGDTLKASQLWVAMTGTLIFLITFRTNKAYARFWDGTTLLHQMWGEWFDAASCLVAFTTLTMRDKKKDLSLDFRHTLVRLVSLLHSSALEEISLTADSEYGYPCLDIGNLDQSSLQYLKDCKFDKNLNFNRVEVIIHMIQILVVHHQDCGVIKIPPPILSRVFQTLSRGQVNLANCKEITSTLFPFPYAQLIACLLLIFVTMTPFVMAGVCEKAHWAFLFTLIPIFGLAGLNYVARELEMPFGDDSNDLPLAEFQDHMNNSMLMLIREESDHVAHTSDTCDKQWQSAKDGISDLRPKHFIDPQRENSGALCSLPLAPQNFPAAPAAAPPAPAAAPPAGAPEAAPKEAATPSEPKMKSLPAASVEPTHRALEQVVQTISKELGGVGKALITCADILGAQLAENENKKNKQLPRPPEVVSKSSPRQAENKPEASQLGVSVMQSLLATQYEEMTL